MVPGVKIHLTSLSPTSDQMIHSKFQEKNEPRNSNKVHGRSGGNRPKPVAHRELESMLEDASALKYRLYRIEFALAGKEAGAERFRYNRYLQVTIVLSTIDEHVAKIGEAIQMPIELHCHNDLGMVVG